jgi:hypothetical protein
MGVREMHVVENEVVHGESVAEVDISVVWFQKCIQVSVVADEVIVEATK